MLLLLLLVLLLLLQNEMNDGELGSRATHSKCTATHGVEIRGYIVLYRGSSWWCLGSGWLVRSFGGCFARRVEKHAILLVAAYVS